MGQAKENIAEASAQFKPEREVVNKRQSAFKQSSNILTASSTAGVSDSRISPSRNHEKFDSNSSNLMFSSNPRVGIQDSQTSLKENHDVNMTSPKALGNSQRFTVSSICH